MYTGIDQEILNARNTGAAAVLGAGKKSSRLYPTLDQGSLNCFINISSSTLLNFTILKGIQNVAGNIDVRKLFLTQEVIFVPQKHSTLLLAGISEGIN